MPVTITTLRPRVLYLLKVFGVGSLELLRWTFATEETPAALTSAAGLPHELLQAIKRNIQILLASVAEEDQQDQQHLLAVVCNVRDGRGVVVPTASAGEGFLSLDIIFDDAPITYYLFVGIPHSIEDPLC